VDLRALGQGADPYDRRPYDLQPRVPEAWKHPFVNRIIDKGSLKKTITDCYRKYGNAETARFLDAIKELGFHYATLSGTTVSISDIVVPQSKHDIVEKAQHAVDELHRLFDQGFISDDERYNKTIELWSKASEDVTAPCRRRRTRSTRCS